jgi:hypothetical protein
VLDDCLKLRLVLRIGGGPFQFQIFVTILNPTPKTISLNVSSKRPIERVNHLIKVKEDIPFDQQRLILAGEHLDDGLTLSPYNILEDSTLEFFFLNNYYYEEIKRKLKRRPVYEYRCDETLKGKTEGSTRLTYTGFRCGGIGNRWSSWNAACMCAACMRMCNAKCDNDKFVSVTKWWGRPFISMIILVRRSFSRCPGSIPSECGSVDQQRESPKILGSWLSVSAPKKIARKHVTTTPESSLTKFVECVENRRTLLQALMLSKTIKRCGGDTLNFKCFFA